MNTPTWSLVLQTIANVAIALTFVVYFFQLRAMRGQLAAAQDASLGQNLVSLHKFISEESFRQDRRTLIELAEAGRALETWTEDERRAAERVCAAYNIVGVLVSYNVIPYALVYDLRYSMTKCHSAAESLLREARRMRTPDMWHHFSDVVARFQAGPEDHSRPNLKVLEPPNLPMQPSGFAGG